MSRGPYRCRSCSMIETADSYPMFTLSLYNSTRFSTKINICVIKSYFNIFFLLENVLFSARLHWINDISWISRNTRSSWRFQVDLSNITSHWLSSFCYSYFIFQNINWIIITSSFSRRYICITSTNISSTTTKKKSIKYIKTKTWIIIKDTNSLLLYFITKLLNSYHCKKNLNILFKICYITLST